MIKGRMIISVPVDRIALEYAMDMVVFTPVIRWIYAPRLSTILAREVLTRGMDPQNILE